MARCPVCIPYTNSRAIITSTDYRCPVSPAPLPAEVTFTLLPDQPSRTSVTQYNVTIASFSYILTTYFDTSTGLSTGELGFHSPEITVNFTFGSTGTTMLPCTTAPLAVQNTVRIGDIPNDSYFFNLLTCCQESLLGVSVTFIRAVQRIITSTGNVTTVDGPLVLCPCKCPNSSCKGDQFDDTEITIPDITITAQTTLDDQNLGEVNFIIRDRINYHCSVAKGRCKQRSVPMFKLIISCFQQFNPNLVKVVKGCGCTLAEKLNSLEQPPDFAAFVAYSMLKYILYRLLFGKFNIKALYRQYNDELIKAILDSRFCEFGRILLDPAKEFFGYDRYFKYG